MMVLVAGLLSPVGCKVTVIVLSFKIHSGIVHQLGRDCLIQNILNVCCVSFLMQCKLQR